MSCNSALPAVEIVSIKNSKPYCGKNSCNCLAFWITWVEYSFFAVS